MSVDLEAVRIRSASDGDKDLDGSGRDDQQSAWATRSSFWHETTDYVVCGQRHYERVIWPSIWSLWSNFPAGYTWPRNVLRHFFPVLEIFPALRFLPYFKNKIVGHLSSAKNIESFVINNIATCTEVCDYFSQDVSIACYADVLSSLSHRCLSSVCGDVTLLF